MSVEEGQARTCGDCTLCCKLCSVDELAKPAGVWCEYCSEGGCQIHADPKRPEICGAYTCLWLDGVLPEDARPDKIDVVFVNQMLGDLRVVAAMESREGAADEEAVRKLIDRFRLACCGVFVAFEDHSRQAFPPQLNSELEEKLYLDKWYRLLKQQPIVGKVQAKTTQPDG